MTSTDKVKAALIRRPLLNLLQLIRISSIAMTTAVLLVAFLGFVSAELLEEYCGVASNMDSTMGPNIFNGETAATGSNPWMAELLTPGNGGEPPRFFCAGTLINECFVLTAAHCAHNKQEIIVRLGQHDRSSRDNPFKVDIYVLEAHIHNQYNNHTHENDIGLLRLSRCVSYNAHIQPICIQLDPRKKSQLDNIQEFTAVGWGKTRTGASSNVLQTVILDRLPKSECDDYLWNSDRPTQFCAGSSKGGREDTCWGDSGGPLYTAGRYTGVRRQTQLGIISYGTSQCQGVGVYTDVMSYVEWIEKIVLESDIEVVVPKIHFLNGNCIPKSTTKSGTSAFTWLAHIYIDSFPLGLGTLISNKLVISTAYPTGAPLKVVLGRNSGGPEVIYKVHTVVTHQNFVRFSENDIALLRLAIKVLYTDHIRPICMPALNEATSFQEKAVKAEHFLAIGSGQPSSAPVQRLNSTSCHNGNFQKIGRKQMCFQHPQSTSLASGSPLVRQFGYGEAKVYTLVGMASFGRSDLRGPDVYTDVLSYSNWIRDNGRFIKRRTKTKSN